MGGNAQLQNVTKTQASKIMELTAAYDDVNRKLATGVQQYDVTIKKMQQIELEFKSLRTNYDQSVKLVKDYETKLAGFNKQVNELTIVNNNLSSVKIKIEKELATVTRDYEDIARELKMADDSAKKALENEVRSLSVKIEEIETNSVATSKRTIQKMEIRITELETMINEERSHTLSP